MKLLRFGPRGTERPGILDPAGEAPEAAHGHVAAIQGVRNVQTEIPLNEIKHTTELPI
jgi:hypothetical protein